MSGTDPRALTATVTAATAYTVTSNDFVVHSAGAGGNVTFTLPAASTATAGRVLFLSKDEANVSLTLSPASGTINGASTLAIGAAAAHKGVIVVDVGTEWVTTTPLAG